MKPGVEIPDGVDDFGMVFQERDGDGVWQTRPTGPIE
jgi:hypothetical protein